MKKFFITFLLIVTYQFAIAGNNDKINLQDSLKKIENTSDVKVKIATYYNIGMYYNYYKGDSAIFYHTKAEKLAIDSKNYSWLPAIYMWMTSVSNTVLGNYPAGLYYAFELLKNVNLCLDQGLEIHNIPKIVAIDWSNYHIALSYAFLGNKTKALEYISKTESKSGSKQFNEILIKKGVNREYRRMSQAVWAQFFVVIKEYKTALSFNQTARMLNDSNSYEKKWGEPYIVLADIYTHQKEYDKSISAFKEALPYAMKDNYFKDILECYYGIANNFYLLKKYDSSINYASKVIHMSSEITFTEGLLKANQLLFKLYTLKGNRDSALKYIIKTDSLRDVVFNNTKANDAQNMAINEEAKQRALAEQEAKQQKILIITAICAILLAFGIYFNGKRKQKERLRQIEEERKNSELRAARDLQQSMLPKENPKRADLDIATFIRSSTEVGGDYYDFFPQPEGNIYSICGDATGHGVTSGMMVSVAKAGLNGIGPIKPNKILQKLNGVVKRIDLGTLRMSMNIAEISNDEVFLSSAAMPPIYLYKASTNSVEEFMNNGLPLGGLRDEEFFLETRKFESGDVLVQLSDGLPEAPNSKGDMYDYDRLRALIQTSCHLSSKEIINVLIQSVDQWLEGQNNPDDITLVVTKKI
jgi:sigma-B regulation protein RsbU (phosphoserine phosphatase)